MGKGVLLELLPFDAVDDAEDPPPLLDKEAILTDVGQLIVVDFEALTTVPAVPMGFGFGMFLLLLLLPLLEETAAGCHTRGNRTLDSSCTVRDVTLDGIFVDILRKQQLEFRPMGRMGWDLK